MKVAELATTVRDAITVSRVSARPAGAYVIKDGRVRWRPAVDVNRLFATVGAVAIAYLLTRARIEKARAKAAVHTPDRP